MTLQSLESSKLDAFSGLEISRNSPPIENDCNTYNISVYHSS